MKCNDDLLLTVTLPVYNGMPHVTQAVESILKQTYEKFKFIILDDGSTDGTANYLRSISDSRVEVHHQENQGLGNALNRLCSLATTKYIARMDADDISEPTRLEKQIQFIEANQEYSMVGTGVYFFTNCGRLTLKKPALKHQEIRKLLLQGKSGVCHPSIIFCKNAYEKVGGYKLGGAGEDIDFCLRMSEIGLVGNVEEPLFGYRIDNQSLSMAKAKELHLGYSYAISCALCRARGEKEPSIEAFTKEWTERHIFFKVKEAIDSISEKIYRDAITDLIAKRQVNGFSKFALAAAMRPKSTLTSILRKVF